MDVSGPSIPIHIARAYGASSSSAATRLADAAGGAPLRFPADEWAPAVRGGAGGPSKADPARELIAARVPGGIDFSGAAPAPRAPWGAGGAVPMYRHPADRNAAATGVEAGRVIDVRG